MERSLPTGSVPREQSPMELLRPRELSQTTEVLIPTAPSRVTIPDPNDTLGDPVVERIMQQLLEAAGRLVASRSVPGSGVTAPYGTNDDTGREELLRSRKEYMSCYSNKISKNLKNLRQEDKRDANEESVACI